MIQPEQPPDPPALDTIAAQNVSRRFDTKVALDRVSLAVGDGEVRALLGPNGAGKTTLLRTLSGLVDPDEGVVRVGGVDTKGAPRWLRQHVGLVPSGDRSFYLRISALENLRFFARLYGLGSRQASARCLEVLRQVGLQDSPNLPVSAYSHGMQKRLAVARALLANPRVLLVDEATHDLDPEGAQRVRELVRSLADTGAAVLWTTQRLEEIRGFAHNVTVLHRGTVRFNGSVSELLALSKSRHYMLRLRNGSLSGADLVKVVQEAVLPLGTIAVTDNPNTGNFLLSLREGVVLGHALASITAANVDVLACREARSEIEDVFLTLTRAREVASE